MGRPRCSLPFHQKLIPQFWGYGEKIREGFKGSRQARNDSSTPLHTVVHIGFVCLSFFLKYQTCRFFVFVLFFFFFFFFLPFIGIVYVDVIFFVLFCQLFFCYMFYQLCQFKIIQNFCFLCNMVIKLNLYKLHSCEIDCLLYNYIVHLLYV